MKIAFFDLASIYYPGGCEKYFVNIGNHLAKNGYNVSFYGSKQYNHITEYIYHFVSGVAIGSTKYVDRNTGKAKVYEITWKHCIPFSHERKKIKKAFLACNRIYVKNEFNELFFLYFLLGKDAYKKRVIIGVHSAIFIPESVKGIWKIIHDVMYTNGIYKSFLQNAYRVHVSNTDYIDLLKKKYVLPSSKIICIPYPIDWKTSLHIDAHKKCKIFWAGRLVQQKGIDRLTSILAILSKKKIFDDIEIIIGGEGEEKPKIEALAKRYSQVSYIGFVKDMQKIYEKVDFCITTSYFEIFPYSVIEPLSFGLPVVTYYIPGPKDMIVSAKYGALVKDERTFVKEVIKLAKEKLTSTDIYTQRREYIYKQTNKRFSQKTIFKKIDDLFK